MAEDYDIEYVGPLPHTCGSGLIRDYPDALAGTVVRCTTDGRRWVKYEETHAVWWRHESRRERRKRKRSAKKAK